MKIDNITPEQTARFAEWAKKWIDIGLSTEPADFDTAHLAALKTYKLCNLDRPMVVLRMGSPYSATVGGTLAWSMLRQRDQVRDQVFDQVSDQVRNQVRNQVSGQVFDQVRNQVFGQVSDQVRNQVREGLYNYYGGQLWGAGFCAYVSFFRDVMGWQDSILERFEIEEDLARSCGWVWWHENVLAISDRPYVINRDEAGRLHCETGPSIAYRDGWSLYYWHGVSIPSEWVERKSELTAKTALTWENVEQRRAGCELIGWANVLKELNAKTIDKNGDPQVGTLLEVNLPDSGKERFIHVLCGTGREFALPVPRECNTALEANMWTYGLDADAAFIPEVRT